MLDDAERARANRFRFAADRNAYIAAHALARAMLSRRAGIAPHQWRFRATERGKPEIDPAFGRPDLRFSLSHTHGMVACAVACTARIGIDVEACATSVPVLETARRLFATSELRYLADLPADQLHAAFYRIWTLKEAYLKALGTGLTDRLDGFAVSLDPVCITFSSEHAPTPGAWQFHEYNAGPHHMLALAVQLSEQGPLRLDAAEVASPQCLASEDFAAAAD